MAPRIGAHRHVAAELERQAEQDQADGNRQAAADALAAAAARAAQADALTPAQQARTWWERDHEPQRQAARAARAELGRRGIQPAPEPRRPDAEAAEETLTAKEEAGSLAAWWQQFDTAAQTAEAALATERENAIAAGQPWPPRTAAAPEPAANTRTTLEWDKTGPQPAHVDPEWHAQIKAAQTASVQADKAARREASARACPVTDAEIALYGHHQDPDRYAPEGGNGPSADAVWQLAHADAQNAAPALLPAPPAEANAEAEHQADPAPARNDLAAALGQIEAQFAERRAEETLRQERSDYAARITREAEREPQAQPETHHDEPDLET